jgi:hypothetical protein
MGYNNYNKGVQSADDLLKGGTYCAVPDPKRNEPPEYDVSKYASEPAQNKSGGDNKQLVRAGSYDSYGVKYNDPSKNKQVIDPKYAFLFKGKKMPGKGGVPAGTPGKVNVTDRIGFGSSQGVGGVAPITIDHSSPTRRAMDDSDRAGINFGWVYTRLAVAFTCAIVTYIMFAVIYAKKGVKINNLDPTAPVMYGY